MKIRKKPIESKTIKKLEKLNEDYSIDEMAEQFEIGRNTMGEILRDKRATPAIQEKIEAKLIEA
jgi:predicted DNA-binding protein YlxM (UPF0122 family)